MSLPIIANTWRVAVRGATPSSRQWANVYHAKWTGAGTAAPADVTAMNQIITRLYTGAVYGGGQPWLAACVAATTLIDITSLPLDGLGLGSVYANAAAGGAAGSSMPNEVSAVITLRTAIRGRRYRGRVFMPPCGMNAGQVTASGGIAVALQSSTVAQFAGAIAALVAVNWQLAVASYGVSDTKAGHITWTPFATPVVSTTCDGKFDVQRRRK